MNCKLFLYALMVILLILNTAAVWEEFNFDSLNTGKVNGTGYFNERTIINLTDSLNGMDFQPLVSDMDNNGKNEIIIFSGNYLKLFDNKLNLINEKFVGNLLGQPTVFNIDDDLFKEIIFISNISSIDYFFAYEYNGSFNQEFNITVANGGIGSGIKCTALGSTNVCVFMDNSQYIHIVNLTSKTDSSYNTSAYNDTQEKIPAIGDLHNNGSLQAVFWFDENNGNNYGLLVFDLTNKNLDSAFNNNGIVDNIVQPFGTRFVLKGHPVLVDLNNDGKLEIAISAFYDDVQTTAFRDDWFTHLWVFNDSGSELFNKCESGFVGCNDNVDPNFAKWEGTNPFVLDINDSGTEDICFIKDKKISPSNSFKNMTINCYNYSGDLLLDSELVPSTTTVSTATLADMNNDGKLEIVTPNSFYFQNGTSFFGYGFSTSNFVIPVDVDGNQGLDLILSKSSQTKIFLDDSGIVEVSNVSISPLIVSSEDSLSCSFVVEGNGDLKANVSWYKDNILQSTETNIVCNNGTACNVVNPIPDTSTAENELWECSVTAFNESFKSYTKPKKTKIFGKTSEWANYCNNENNLCRQSGISYFSNADTKSTTNNSEGMEFEPLVADINNDGKNEIIIFSNENLIIYNHSLGLINKINVGNLVGQPTIYNIDSDNNLEIIFMTNVSSTSYFMAYDYNNGFTKQCNETISNGASGSGIKCADIGSTKSCFFKDQKNVFYNFNMSSCSQTANLTTNNQEDTTPTVPSILDYDNDNKLEGLWWFNNDSDQFMGIAVIELGTMTFDTGFNNNGFIDDITQGSGSDYRAGFENVKGNPIFYQQDNGGGYEILIAYDNEKIAGMVGDEFKCFRSVLKTFDTDGTLLWTVRPTTCEQPSTGTYNCDMSTPVIVDVNKDDYEDICFILEGDSACYQNAPDDYFYCLDRFGNNVDGYPKNTSDVNKYGSASASIDTSMYLADMDNDGNIEMIGAGYIWELNGTILKGNYSSFTTFAPIPVDVDKNGVLELIGSKVNETNIFRANVEVCSNRIQVQSIDYNNNYIPNTNVFVDNVLKGTTDSLGLFESQESGICTDALSYTVKCQNNIITCETKSVTLSNDGGFQGIPFDCSVCGSEVDLKITIDNINTNKNDNEVTVNITIINIPNTNNVNITFKVQDSDGLISRENSQLFNINSNDRFKFITQSITLSGNDDFVHVYVDPNNNIIETDEKNNYVLIPLFEKQVDAYLNISTGYNLVDNEIKDYIKLFVNEKSQNNADVTIAVGLPNKNTIINNKNSLTKTNYKWYFDNIVYYNNKPLGSKPYNGLVGAFSDDFNYIFVVGNDIDGLLAAVKRLISARELFFNNFNKDKVSVIEDTDVAGISVADLFRNPSNFPYYEKRGTIMFANVVGRILNDNNFEIDIKTVKTYNDNTTLRLKNVNSDFSNSFKDVVVGNTKPVVLARGLWSNLLTWNDFGQELAFDKDNARDTWLIEITGGPKTECDTCPNYEYEDLVDYYWPALITGVQNYSKQKTLDYVGFSNGCRVALDSLKNWSSNGKTNAGYVFDSVTGNYLEADLSSSPVDTFVGVGCPGAFEGESLYSDCWKKYGDEMREIIGSKKHVTPRDMGKALIKAAPITDIKCELAGRLSSSNKGSISYSLADKYLNFVEHSSDNQPGGNVNANKFILVRGVIPLPLLQRWGIPLLYTKTDLVVTKEDMDAIFSNANASQKFYYKSFGAHTAPVSLFGLADSLITKSIIKDLVNGKERTNYEYLLLNSTN